MHNNLFHAPDVPNQSEPAVRKLPRADAAFWVLQVLAFIAGDTIVETLYGFTDSSAGLLLASITALVAAVLALHQQGKRYTFGYGVASLLVSVGAHAIVRLVLNGPHPVTLLTVTLIATLLAGASAVWFFGMRATSFYSLLVRRDEIGLFAGAFISLCFGATLGRYLVQTFDVGNPILGIVFTAPFVAIQASPLARIAPVSSFWTSYLLLTPLGVVLGALMLQSQLLGDTGWSALLSAGFSLSAFAALQTYLVATHAESGTLCRVDGPTH